MPSSVLERDSFYTQWVLLPGFPIAIHDQPIEMRGHTQDSDSVSEHSVSYEPSVAGLSLAQ